MAQEPLDEWADEELVQISSLQHYTYCPRQCGLIYLEQTFDENVFTLRGRALHERTDEPLSTEEDGVHVERALPLFSHRLGLVGKADVVEFHSGAPYPVEYKQGRRRRKLCDEIQVCAQALCLEEMTGLAVPRGAVYYYTSRRRRVVEMTRELRARVAETVVAVRAIVASGRLPPPAADRRCTDCSLRDACQPEVLGAAGRLDALLASLFRPEGV